MPWACACCPDLYFLLLGLLRFCSPVPSTGALRVCSPAAFGQTRLPRPYCSLTLCFAFLRVHHACAWCLGRVQGEAADRAGVRKQSDLGRVREAVACCADSDLPSCLMPLTTLLIPCFCQEWQPPPATQKEWHQETGQRMFH